MIYNRHRARRTHSADIFTLPLLTDFPTLHDALSRYQQTITPHKKGALQESRRIDIWLKHPLANQPLNALQGRHFSIYRDARISDGVSADTIRLELAIISNLYTVAAIDWGYEGLTNPIMKMRKPAPSRGRRRRLNEADQLLLLKTADEVDKRLKPLILLLIHTAMRRGELCDLQWEDVDFSRRVALLQDTKNGEDRTVPLSPSALEILRELHINRTSNAVCELSPDRLSHLFIKTVKRSGLENLRLHDLRHEATSRLFEMGTLDMMEIAGITGHKSLQMLKRYTHLNAARLAEKLK